MEGTLPRTTMQEIGTELWMDRLHALWRHSLEGGPALPWDLQNTLLCGLELNHLETLRYLHQERPSFEVFKEWVFALNGEYLTEAALDRLEAALSGAGVASPIGSLDDVPGLSAEELAHWDEHGYVVVRQAVRAEDAEAAELAIYKHLEMDRGDAESWYSEKLGHTIWVPLLRHPVVRANRFAPRVVKAFAQLWGREDLWATVDQTGLNPPERPGWTFPGPHLHWDTTLAEPRHFGIQGILYLAETEAAQGAFCCVPGFHKTLDAWLAALPEGVDARAEALRTLKAKPIAAGRGDLILWHHSLPHGSSPNRSTRPRVVQYMSMRPSRWAYNPEWR